MAKMAYGEPVGYGNTYNYFQPSPQGYQPQTYGGYDPYQGDPNVVEQAPEQAPEQEIDPELLASLFGGGYDEPAYYPDPESKSNLGRNLAIGGGVALAGGLAGRLLSKGKGGRLADKALSFLSGGRQIGASKGDALAEMVKRRASGVMDDPNGSLDRGIDAVKGVLDTPVNGLRQRATDHVEKWAPGAMERAAGGMSLRDLNDMAGSRIPNSWINKDMNLQDYMDMPIIGRGVKRVLRNQINNPRGNKTVGDMIMGGPRTTGRRTPMGNDPRTVAKMKYLNNLNSEMTRTQKGLALVDAIGQSGAIEGGSNAWNSLNKTQQALTRRNRLRAGGDAASNIGVGLGAAGLAGAGYEQYKGASLKEAIPLMGLLRGARGLMSSVGSKAKNFSVSGMRNGKGPLGWGPMKGVQNKVRGGAGMLAKGVGSVVSAPVRIPGKMMGGYVRGGVAGGAKEGGLGRAANLAGWGYTGYDMHNSFSNEMKMPSISAGGPRGM